MSSPFDSLLQELARRDFLTYQHSIAVAEHMKNFAVALNLDEESIRDAEILGAIHDIGKTKISPELFKKLQSGHLPTKEERAQLNQSSETLLEILGKDPLSPSLHDAITHLNCRFDGKGTPTVAGETIPQLARMLKIVDYFDMLTRQRTGRAPLSEEKSRQVLTNNSGVLFDPVLVSVFLQ